MATTPATSTEWKNAADRHYAAAVEAFDAASAYGNEVPNPGLERAQVALQLARYSLDRAAATR